MKLPVIVSPARKAHTSPWITRLRARDVMSSPRLLGPEPSTKPNALNVCPLVLFECLTGFHMRLWLLATAFAGLERTLVHWKKADESNFINSVLLAYWTSPLTWLQIKESYDKRRVFIWHAIGFHLTMAVHTQAWKDVEMAIAARTYLTCVQPTAPDRASRIATVTSVVLIRAIAVRIFWTNAFVSVHANGHLFLATAFVFRLIYGDV